MTNIKKRERLMPQFISLNQSLLNSHKKYTFLFLMLFININLHASESCTSLYEKGKFTQAFNKCSIDATNNSSNAHYILGQLYTNGLGVEKNINKGISYYRQAVLNNDVDSQIALGKFHVSNDNYLQSHIFFSLAIDNGSLNALSFKNEAEESLTAQELERSKAFLNIVKAAIEQQRKIQQRKQLVSN
ncbi:MAG: hypothetical protein OQL19_10950 [Gammaproteobacteria bacterium]|nr:hypothetical protein [Gammaproteobacteria bacterium]